MDRLQPDNIEAVLAPEPPPLPPQLPGPVPENSEQADNAFNTRLPAWEQSGSWARAFFKTTWQMLSHPGLTLSQPAFPGYASLLAFALPWIVFHISVTMLYAGVFKQGTFTISLLLLEIVSALLHILIGVCLLHLVFMIVRANKGGWRATCRAQAYLCCVYCFMALPRIGILLSAVWGLFMFFPAMAASHQVSRLRILGALLLLVGILLFIMMLAAMLFGAAVLYQLLGTLQQGRGLPW